MKTKTPTFSFADEYQHLPETKRVKFERLRSYVNRYGVYGIIKTIVCNFPVIIGFTVISFVLLILDSLPLKTDFRSMFAAYYTRFNDPLMYMRLVTSSLLHVNALHFARNFSVILLIGPIVEKRYKSIRLLIMMICTSLITGLVHVTFNHGVRLMGASDIAYMLIMAGACLLLRDGRFPFLPLIIGVSYIGSEFLHAFTANDGISHVSHVIGGLCGVGFGLMFKRKKTWQKAGYGKYGKLI